MLVNTKHRTGNPEIMDDFTLEGDALKLALDKIAQINQLLGGNRLTLKGVAKLLKNESNSSPVTIVDVGCGNGDMLRKLADFGFQNNLNLELIGVDANPFTVNYAIDLSRNYPNIKYRCEDVFSQSFNELKFDILLCTLTLHHFSNDEIIELLTIFNRNSKLGFVVNDLHRNSVAYRLFQGFCFVFRMNKMSREDGLTSILRGFKKDELIAFSENLRFKKYSIQWKWAFRYQWIVEK
ncbi:methyltransferase domain-containing protein [Flavobacterium sp. M31R6]|uniref:methyltransferase domain-containing protein n=1 Tax=Flavobacterium sp. M31R6 TaxID=2739062 RepID=UPI001568417F|nr:methyltransferase domain-containing protein [Flavobacterium sp. M31R6]QKJ63845.1 methyltransferase domain-containing protein [Flavobacterium sp. M31R6]